MALKREKSETLALDKVEILDALQLFKNGDFTKRLPTGFTGIDGKIADTYNEIVQIEFETTKEVERVYREIVEEGKVSSRANSASNNGNWKVKINALNSLIDGVFKPLLEMTRVIGAVSKGDLSQKIALETENGPIMNDFLHGARIVNEMVDQLDLFATELIHVTREVGTDGKLGGQAKIEGVSGVWKELVDNVNLMAANLTDQMRDISKVAIGVADGDLSKTITVDARGEISQLKDAINGMVERLRSFSSEVTRVAREVGTDGKLGGQGRVEGASGVWKELVDNVNLMAANLTDQMRDISKVAIGVADGDLSKTITVDARGEISQLKDAINGMVERLRSFSSEVTRVAREVGTDGKLGGQGKVAGVSGVWKELVDNVNLMAANLTDQMRDISKVAIGVADGDLSKMITVNARGEIQQLKDAINGMVERLRSFSSEVTRVAREVGTDGKLGGQGKVEGASGVWKELVDNVNLMAANLTDQMRDISKVAIAVADGDLSKTITVDARGEISQLKDAINGMVEQLRSFSSEVTRVAREVGTDGKLGGQGKVEGASGTWKELVDNVNLMAASLTDQVRDISKVAIAVADGDLSKTITVDAQGEILQLKDAINGMVEQLRSFSSEVTRVAREVGTDGKLGGQANVEGVSGTWKNLTDRVNYMAASLTSQVRAIAKVATAVTNGDLNQEISVEARGELDDLKNNINQMIENLRSTTQKNTDQDWLKSNLARFAGMLQGERDIVSASKQILSELALLVKAQHGVFYLAEDIGSVGDQKTIFKLLSSYAYKQRKNLSNQFAPGEGLVGQCALEKQQILIRHAPSDYIRITSGLGEAVPVNIIVLPVVFEDEAVAVIELASLQEFSEIHISFLDQLMENIGIVINNIKINSRTEGLLQQSQTLTEELQTQQEELQQANEELEEKANALSEQNTEVERKNIEIEQARHDLEEKAEQLAITSKYKSEFLANMSHELRTPLNSLLILAQQLSDNPDKNLSGKQVKYAETIHASGSDLLNLINDILDLSKIESGTVTADIQEVPITDIQSQVDRTFKFINEQKGVSFNVDLAKNLPKSIFTDSKRLLQVIKNLLSNASKFTEKGSITLKVNTKKDGWNSENQILNRAKSVIAFSVVDTGIGIPVEKQKIIFEAFQQADSGTARKYGGTGLGLAISREIAQLLGGELKLVKSEPNKGSTFTLFMPVELPDSLISSEEDASVEKEKSTGPRQIQIKRKLYEKDEDSGGRAGGNQLSELKKKVLIRVESEESIIPDDRSNIGPDEKTILIVEDDVRYASILLDAAHEQGFKGIIALEGRSALILAREYKPSAITLDLHLPDIDGWEVLDRIKGNPETMHIPVHIISINDEKEESLRHGAYASMKKPANREDLEKILSDIYQFTEKHVSSLLIVEDDPVQQEGIVDLLGNKGDLNIVTVGTGKDTIAKLKKEKFDCMVLDLNLPDMSGFDLLEKLQKNSAIKKLPIIVYTAQDITQQEEKKLKKFAKSVILKDVHSSERLLAETTLFLHRVASDLPDAKRKILEDLYLKDSSLNGRKVLIVDDDMRNIFAMTSMLERNNLNILSAESGKEALKTLQENPDIDVVIMDIMMPEMDGYETTRRIREIEQFKKLPIIALTAKAMKGDREKCIAAGASDYITKPVNINQLLSLLRIWLYK